MKKERIFGLDILRILSMLGIVGLHILNKGGWLASADSTPEVLIARIVAVICYCSVNVFAMLTGYLYADRKSVRSSNLLKLILTVVFYCATILAVFALIKPELFFGFRGLYLYAIFPPIAGRYWYITSYVLLFMMIPYINTMIRSLKEIQLRRMLLFLLLSVVSTFGLNDYFKLSGGYSPFWLIFCYIVGAYIKLYKDTLHRKHLLKWSAMLAAVLILALCAWYVLGDSAVGSLFLILHYISPFMVLEAALLLLIFSKITIRHSLSQKLVLSLSNGAFGVYIIHSHILIFDYILVDAFSWTGQHGTLIYVAALIAGLGGIYLVCWIIDVLRSLLFKWLCLDKFADWLGGKLDSFLHWT